MFGWYIFMVLWFVFIIFYVMDFEVFLLIDWYGYVRFCLLKLRCEGGWFGLFVGDVFWFDFGGYFVKFLYVGCMLIISERVNWVWIWKIFDFEVWSWNLGVWWYLKGWIYCVEWCCFILFSLVLWLFNMGRIFDWFII